MKIKKSKIVKAYVCIVCSKKSKGKKRCCGKNMMDQEKGSWNS